MKKQGFTHRVEFPQFEVLKLLQEHHSISEIAKYRKVSRTAVYKVLTTLKKKSMIRRIGYGVYELTPKGMQGLHSFVGLRYKLRQHNLHFKIKVLESPRNWALRRNELRQLPYFNRTLKLKNNDQDLFSYGKLQVKTTSKSVILKMPTIYATNWEHAIIQAIQILEDAIVKIEDIFKVKLVKDHKANITIISQEYARLQDALAKIYRQEGNRIYLTGEDGKIWLITDFSFATNETEFIHTDRATDDVDAIAPFLNDLRANPITFSEVTNHLAETQGIVNSWARNQVKHQGVLDDILIAFRKINERLDKAEVLWGKDEK
jgi:DNA-binding Lrp family transcriptional regulator